MKKLLIQPCVLMIIALGMLATSCEDTKIEKDYSVKFEVVGMPTQTELTIRLTPEEGSTGIAYAIGQAADRESFNDGKIPGYMTVAGSAAIEVSFEDLEPGVAYTVFARALNGEAKSAIADFVIKTASDKFMVKELYVTDFTAGIKVNTSSDYSRYIYYLGEPGDKEKFENNELEHSTASQVYEYTYNYWDLEPNKEYAFFVKGWDRANNETSTYVVNFKTAELGSDKIPNFEFTPGKADFYQQIYTVTPNAKCRQLVLRQSYKNENQANIEDVYNGDVMAMLDSWKDATSELMTCYMATGETLIANPKTPKLELNAELDLYVVMYDDNFNLAGVKKFNAKTPGKNANASTDGMDVTIDVTKAAQDGVTFTVNTKEDTRFYLMDIYDAKAYNKVAPGGVYDPMKTFQADLLSRPSSTVICYDQRAASYVNTEITYVLGAKYYIVVCPTNENGPHGDGFGAAEVREITIAN